MLQTPKAAAAVVLVEQEVLQKQVQMVVQVVR
jgi:hypothetical protein